MKKIEEIAPPNLGCTKCGNKYRIVVYRRAGASGTRIPEPQTRMCASCAGEKPDRER